MIIKINSWRSCNIFNINPNVFPCHETSVYRLLREVGGGLLVVVVVVVLLPALHLYQHFADSLTSSLTAVLWCFWQRSLNSRWVSLMMIYLGRRPEVGFPSKPSRSMLSAFVGRLVEDICSLSAPFSDAFRFSNCSMCFRNRQSMLWCLITVLAFSVVVLVIGESDEGCNIFVANVPIVTSLVTVRRSR